MSPARPHVLLVGVSPNTAASLRTELAPTADVATASVAQVLDHTDGPVGERHPTLVVIGQEPSAPVGLIHAVRPHAADLAVIVVSTSATKAELAALPLFFSPDQARQVPETRIDRLPGTARELLEGVVRRRAYSVSRAAAQEQLTSGASINRQLGEHLFGEFLARAPVGAVMLDDAGTLVAWNHLAADVFRLADPESLGQPLTAFFPPSSGASLRRHLAAPADDRPTDFDAVFERSLPDGATQALRLAPQRLVDVRGQERTLVLVDDVTDRLRTQRQLAERTNHALLSAEVAAALTMSGSLPERLRRCTHALVERLDAVSADVWTLRPSGEALEAVATSGTGTGGADGDVSVPVGRFLVGRVAAERRSLLCDIPADDLHSAPGGRPRAFAGCPLVSDGDVTGVLAVTSLHPLSDTVAGVLEGVADQIAVGIRQDRLLDHLRTTTQALERPLLPPRLPELSGFDVSARYYPYVSGLDIGGDFYDVFTAPDGRHVMVLGDVCGKGPTAASVTGLVRHTLWAAAQRTPDPAYVLAVVNRAMLREHVPFCTLVYAVADPGTSPVRLRLASAGHPPPLLRRPDGATAPLDVRGPFLGVFENVRYDVVERDLLPGGTLLLYTDGFTEGAGSYRPREPEDLAAVVTGHSAARSDRPAAGLTTALLEDAHARWGGRLRDDLAVLALTALPVAARHGAVPVDRWNGAVAS